MRLYHFTSPEAVPSIREIAIRTSFLHIPGAGQSKHAVVSLTVNPDPAGLLHHTLGDGSPLSGSALAEWQVANPGLPAPPSPNTIAFRIHLEIPETDDCLFLLEYPDVGELGFTSQPQVERFIELGGGVPGDWLIYRGVVPVRYIVAVDET
jgi:hypothetical protein